MTVEQTQQLHEEQLQYQLQLQASQLQNVFGRHDLPAAIVGGSVDKRSFRFDLNAHMAGGLQLFSGLKEEIKKALGVESVSLINDDGNLQLQLIRPFEPAVPLLDLLAILPDVPPATAVLGLAEDGSPMTHTFSAKLKPNVLISGQADAGKTILLRTIAASLAITSREAQVQLIAINPVSGDRQRQQLQDSALRPLSYLPHMLTEVASRQSEITELLLFLVREMNYRIEHDFTIPRIVVLIDQAATVMEHGGRTVAESIQRLAQQGADAGIHLVLSTRRPEAAVFGPHLSTNLQARFIGKLDIRKAVEGKSRLTGVEATTLLGEGDFLAAGRSGDVRFQAAYINDYDLHMSLSRLRKHRPILLAQPIDRRVKLEQESSKHFAQKQQFSFADGMVSVA